MKLPRFDKASVLVIGDVMLDRYWHGATERVSAEAPVPIVDVNEREERPGAAANVALNVMSLGARASLIGMIGNDEAGATLHGKLEGAGINCQLVTKPDYQTTTKLRIVSMNQQLLRVDFESHETMDDKSMTASLENALAGADNVLFSDYDKGVLDNPQLVIGKARELDKPVMVDPKFKDFALYRGATILKPNRLELQRAVGQWTSESDMLQRCQRLMRDLEIEALLVTRSAEGMTLVKNSGASVHFPARMREIYDATGAGDTVIATLCSALGAGETLNDAVGLANIAAGLVVSHFGNTSVSGPELRDEIVREAGFDTGIMSQEQLLNAVSEAKKRGEKVVLTNGCFDLLHAGHVDYLQEAKSEGDRLIVALNSDESIRRLKEVGRPVTTLDHRMAIVAGLKAVDWVVPFEEDTPENLISVLQPDVLVKGGDYKNVDQVVGADIVKSYGGSVKVLSLVEDCSTSAIVQKIRDM
jgi:D-beta-D-heptose 7-phosphate kinase/D-beta-D-heptose 1-phosphate adenosyltransferase